MSDGVERLSIGPTLIEGDSGIGLNKPVLLGLRKLLLGVEGRCEAGSGANLGLVGIDVGEDTSMDPTCLLAGEKEWEAAGELFSLYCGETTGCLEGPSNGEDGKP